MPMILCVFAKSGKKSVWYEQHGTAVGCVADDMLVAFVAQGNRALTTDTGCSHACRFRKWQRSQGTLARRCQNVRGSNLWLRRIKYRWDGRFWPVDL
jgi:hypothetical protein